MILSFKANGKLGLVVLAALAGGCSPIRWERSYETGIKRAADLNRRALVQFHSHWSPACREMDQEAFAEPEVQKLMQRFVCIQVDDVLDRKLSEQFGVQIIPSFYIIRPDMSVAGSQTGKLDAQKFRGFLIKHSYD